MTITSRELISGASASGKPYGIGVKWTRKRVFRVSNLEGGEHQTLTQQEAYYAADVDIGDGHPDDSGCLALTVSMQPVNKSGGAIDVSWTYVSSGADFGGSDQTPENGVVSAGATGLALVKWRHNPSVPNGGNVGGMLGGVDIGGSSIDIKGVGFTMLHTQQTLQVTLLTPDFPNMNVILEIIGTRNSSPFLGAAYGSVLYKGASNMSKSSDNSWTTTHSFLWDKQYHLRQCPDRDEYNKPKQGTGTWADKAYPVFWVQPFPDTRSFQGLGINI